MPAAGQKNCSQSFGEQGQLTLNRARYAAAMVLGMDGELGSKSMAATM